MPTVASADTLRRPPPEKGGRGGEGLPEGAGTNPRRRGTPDLISPSPLMYYVRAAPTGSRGV
jgi:hypothetical protein